MKISIHTLLLAVPASALSLSNFQLITSSSVPLACILAYNQQLGNCALGDFTQSLTQNQRRDGNTCSAACQAGIAAAQQTIKTSCSGLRVGSTGVSVLGVALTGDLVGLLCGGQSTATTSTSSVSVSTVSTAALTNNVNGVATEAATEATTATTATTETATTTESTSAITSITSTIGTDDTAEASLSLLLASLSSLSFFSATMTAESFVQSAATSITVKTGKTTATATATSTSKDTRETPDIGGGSPFDAQVVNGAVRTGPSICASIVAVGIAVLLFSI